MPRINFDENVDNYVLQSGLNKGETLDSVKLQKLDKYFVWLEERQPLYGGALSDYNALKEYFSDPVIAAELEK